MFWMYYQAEVNESRHFRCSDSYTPARTQTHALHVTHAQTQTHTQTHTQVHARTPPPALARTLSHTYIHTHTDAQTYTPAHTHKRVTWPATHDGIENFQI